MVTLHVHGRGYWEYESTRTPVRATGAGMVLIDADGAADVCAVAGHASMGGILRCARGEAILLVVVPVLTLWAVGLRFPRCSGSPGEGLPGSPPGGSHE